jgi:hypothetical protein
MEQLQSRQDGSGERPRRVVVPGERKDVFFKVPSRALGLAGTGDKRVERK